MRILARLCPSWHSDMMRDVGMKSIIGGEVFSHNQVLVLTEIKIRSPNRPTYDLVKSHISAIMDKSSEIRFVLEYSCCDIPDFNQEWMTHVRLGFQTPALTYQAHEAISKNSSTIRVFTRRRMDRVQCSYYNLGNTILSTHYHLPNAILLLSLSTSSHMCIFSVHIMV